MTVPRPHYRVCPQMWSFLGDLGEHSPGLAHEITVNLAEHELMDLGENVITRELAAGITPEEFADGPVCYLGAPIDASVPDSGEKAA